MRTGATSLFTALPPETPEHEHAHQCAQRKKNQQQRQHPGSAKKSRPATDAAGRLHHKIGGAYVFAGPRIVSPALFDNTPDGAFSFLDLFHKAQAADRLYGFVHQGAWHHAGTPEDLAAINAAYRDLQKMAAI